MCKHKNNTYCSTLPTSNSQTVEWNCHMQLTYMRWVANQGHQTDCKTRNTYVCTDLLYDTIWYPLVEEWQVTVLVDMQHVASRTQLGMANLNVYKCDKQWASYQIRKIARAHAPGMPETFSQPLRVSDPDMHHGTCMTHVPWCMPGSLTSGFLWSQRRGKTFPACPAHAQPAILRIWQEAHGNPITLFTPYSQMSPKSMVLVSTSIDNRITTTGFPILVSWHLYIKSGPC